ncbi:MAG: TetR/AcrR family transcriptional regulator [Pseudomonadales bacterium]|jgi:AcrR family transcriptional regulator|nr:TetR/AcrR family transcriptional regulator [Kiritimatiellia bacterium]MDP6972996.1 TetR/AcrR family transcriptional regulator [Pseudomonadales bacterium]
MSENGLKTPPLRAVNRLSPQDWLKAANQRLISGGIDSVKIGPLAEDLGVTRGSFYWHFKDRDHLLGVMLDTWHAESVEMFSGLLQSQDASGMEEFIRLVHLWVDETSFDPDLEAAMRDWARRSDQVSEVVKDVDEERIDFIKRIFLDFGYDDTEAFIRARITYFHQVGYYTIGYNETLDQRMSLLPIYVHVLTGKLTPEEIDRLF